MDLLQNWPLWHYLTLRGIASSLGQKIYYNIDDDTFVSARDVANMDTRVYRVSDLYLIVGMKKTVNYAYVSLTKKEVPKIPASVASLVQDHRKQDPILSMVYGISTDIQPEAPASEFVPPFAIDVQKIANALRNLSSDQCVNIMSGSKVKISKSYLMNEISTTPICLLRSKNALPQADIPRIFRYVEDELAKLKSSEKSTANASATTIRQNEETKLESLNRLNEQRKSLPRAESPQPSLPKKALPPPPVPKRPSERSRPSSPPKERPRIGTMEIDSLSEQLADIHMRVEEHRNTKSPIAPDIIDSINSSASRTRTRMLSPVRNELPQVLEDRVNAIMHDYEEAEEETLLTKFANASKRSPSLSPRSLSPAHSDREYSGNESEYSNDEEDYYSSGEADEAY